MADSVCFTSATKLARRIESGDLSPVTVVDAFLDRIEARNPTLNAYVTVLEDEAREAAREAEQEVRSDGELGPLHGVPVALKDLYAFKRGVRNTFGCRLFEDFRPTADAPLVERLESAGAIVLGKTNVPEFGHKGTTENDRFGATLNPFDTERTPGGSSGGSAAAVAAGLATFAQGSDHAGSIRMPASACNLYGLYPTFGRIPQGFRPNAYRYHLPRVGSGPLTRTVADAALALNVMAGPHPREPHGIPGPSNPFTVPGDSSLEGVSIASSPTLGMAPVSPAVEAVVEDAASAFSEAGADVERVDPDVDVSTDALLTALETGLEVVYADLAGALRQTTGVDLLEHPDAVEPEVRRRIKAGRETSAMAVRRANVTRSRFFDALERLFQRRDVLVTPTMTIPPFDADVGPPDTVAGQPVRQDFGWQLAWPFNLTGHPAASIPAGVTDGGLPVGVQLVAGRFEEQTLLDVSAAFERLRPWTDRYGDR